MKINFIKLKSSEIKTRSTKSLLWHYRSLRDTVRETDQYFFYDYNSYEETDWYYHLPLNEYIDMRKGWNLSKEDLIEKYEEYHDLIDYVDLVKEELDSREHIDRKL